jgi:GntR family histidine utilization transcriptional repressor
MTLVAKIRTDIETHIRSGKWKPGDQIPFEHELVIQYGCSRATVSKALETMARDGLIERRRKAGSFVAQPHMEAAVLEVPDLSKLISDRGEHYTWNLITQANRLSKTGEELSGQVLALEGLHRASNEPFAIEYRWISLETVPEAAVQSFETNAPGTWLLGHVPWTNARHRITAISANTQQAKLLNTQPHAPCLQMERWTWQVEAPVTYVKQVFRGDRYDLIAEFKPGSTK